MALFQKWAEKFWGPYLPYEITKTQKLIEDTKDITDIEERLAALSEIFDEIFKTQNLQDAQADIYQGLKFLAMWGKLPDEHAENELHPVVSTLLQNEICPKDIVHMVQILCANEVEDIVLPETKLSWAQRTYKSRYASLDLEPTPTKQASSTSDKVDCVDAVRRNILLLRSPET